MPLYEYTSATRTGQVRIELIRSVADRDRCPPGFRRVTVPARIGVARGLMDPGTPDMAVPRAFKEIEQRMGHDAIARQTGFSTKEVKRIWNI